MSAHPEFHIGACVIDYDSPLVIEETGINHEGSLDATIEMVDAAIRAGSEAFKRQAHIIEDEMSPEIRSVIPGNVDVSLHDTMEQCALNEKNRRALMAHLESQGAMFISTSFSRVTAEGGERFGMNYKSDSRQQGRIPACDSIMNVNNDQGAITSALRRMAGRQFSPQATFGDGNSVSHFMTALNESRLWQTSHQKQFRDVEAP